RVTLAGLDHTRIVPSDGPLRLELRHTYGRQELEGDRAIRALSTLLLRVNRGGGSIGTIQDAATLIADARDPRRAIASVASLAQTRTANFEARSREFARGLRAKTLSEVFAAPRTRGIGAQDTRPPTNRGALYRLPAVHRLALEMSLHESSEQFALDEE